jgi:hypothetical protein
MEAVNKDGKDSMEKNNECTRKEKKAGSDRKETCLLSLM